MKIHISHNYLKIISNSRRVVSLTQAMTVYKSKQTIRLLGENE